MHAGQRDMAGMALWWALAAGAVLTAAGLGDERHLRSLLFAGVIVAGASLMSLVTRWGFRGQVPGSVAAITDAPGALALAVANTERIDVIETKLIAITGAIDRRNQADGFPAPDKEDTQPMRRLRAVRDGEASLCGLTLAAALALRGYDRLGVPL